MNKIGIVVFLSTFINFSSSSQFLSGRVTDAEKRPLQGVSIRAYKPQESIIQSFAITDSKGQFQFNKPFLSDSIKLVVATMGFATVERLIKKADLILLDEWGYVPLDRDGARLIFEIVSDCYEKKSLIITTNIEFSRWTHILFDEQMTGALLDRLLHHCHLLMFDGESDRMKTSLLRQG